MNSTPRTIKAAVAEEAAPNTRPLLELMASAPHITAVGSAAFGEAALALVRAASPDVLVVRIAHAAPHALATVRLVMAEHPLPIVVCAMNAEALRPRALEAGAVSCVEAPREPGAAPWNAGDAAGDPAAGALLQAVRLMAEVKVVRRWPRTAPQGAQTGTAATGGAGAARGSGAVDGARAGELRIVGIGTSTGGPAVLRTILGGLPAGFPLPILVVQHIATGFVQGMADWLSQNCNLQVQVAQYGIQPKPGHAYLAPDGFQMGIARGGAVTLARDPSATLCPSATHLFQSLAEVYGPRAVGVLLTGMGKDGAAGLKMMKDKGAITIAQDRESSVVHGMAGAAIALGAATHVMPASQIAGTLAAIAGQTNIERGKP